MAHRSLSWRTPHEAYYGFTPDVAHLIKFVFWGPVLVIDNKTQIPESRDIIGYYAGPVPKKGALNLSWVWTKDRGLISQSVLRHAKINTDHNRCMVLVSGETDTEPYTEPVNTEPINFFRIMTPMIVLTIHFRLLATRMNSVPLSTSIKSYKIIYSSVKLYYFLKVSMSRLSALNSRPILSIRPRAG